MTESSAVSIDPALLSAHDVYRLLMGSVVPRPIAWVTSCGLAGVNAAPFSCYTFVSTLPPMVAISCGRKEGIPKDTVTNAQRLGEFVLNVVGETFLEPMHQSSVEFPADVSEIDALGIAIEPSQCIQVPRILGVPVSMECRTVDVIEFGKLRAQLLVGEVVRFHVRQDCYERGRINFEAMKPIGRLGGPYYASLGEVHHMPPVGPYFHQTSELGGE